MIVKINGVAMECEADHVRDFGVVQELLRQRAVELGILDEACLDADVIAKASETLLGEEIVVPAPREEECRRYYEAHPAAFLSGDLVCARHILFQTTRATPVNELRARAESALNELLADPSRFGAMARELSNCPSGRTGGDLGQLGRGDTAPEFDKALFGKALFGAGPEGLLRDLIKTWFGFHILSIDQRIWGEKLPFDEVREQIAERLREMSEQAALRHYIEALTASAKIEWPESESIVSAD
ncbi:MAG: peptidylprolyl isomerase [Rhodoblastus sp.]